MPSLRFLAVFIALTAQAVGQPDGCPEGFAGSDCSVCNTDDACVAATSDDDAVCDTGFIFTEKTLAKPFSCNPTSPPLVTGLVAPDSLFIKCYTRDPATSGSPLSTPSPAAPSLQSPSPAIEPSPPPSLLPPAEVQSPPAAAAALSSPPPPTAAETAASPPPDATAAATPPPPGVVFNGTNVGGLLDDIGETLAGRRRRQMLQDAAAPSAEFVPYCDISFEVQSPQVQVACRADECGIQLGSGDVTCAKTTCGCVGDATCANNGLVSGLAASVIGKSVLKCSDAGECSLALEGLPVDAIVATCSSGECILPADGGSFNGSNSTLVEKVPVPNPEINALIAALPFVILTIFIAAVGAYAFTHRAMWTAPPASSPFATAALDADSKDLANLRNTSLRAINALEFRGVAVEVAMKPEAIEKKRAGLRFKALNGSSGEARRSSAPAPALASILRLGRRSSSEEVSASKAAGGLDSADSLGRSPSAELQAAADYVSDLHAPPAATSWTIIRDCSGCAAAGEVTGVLGPSGCGKTTLLGAIAGSPMDLGATASLQGSIMIDGAPRRGTDVAYVPQADYLIPSLTVAECVRYSAQLRLPRDTPAAVVHARVARVLAELGLRHVADAYVGGAGQIRGVSGGERRRVSIGMELVTNPSIIVLDEPTSGLDSYTAVNLMKTLREVAVGGRVVVASLHQPSRDMFFSLDRVILMGHGRMLFNGRPEEAESALAAAGLAVPAGVAVAEHLLKVASSPANTMAMLKAQTKPGASPPEARDGAARPGTSRSEDEHRLEGEKSGETTDAMEAAMPPDVSSLGASSAISGTPSPVALSGVPPQQEARSAGFTRQLSVMFWRTGLDIFRSPTLLMLHVIVSIVVGVITGAIFFDLQLDFNGVQNRMGGTFFALCFLAFTSLTTIDLLMNERHVVMREVRSGYYRPAAYLLSKLALDGMLLRAIPAILYWIPFYYMAGFRTAAPYAATYAFTLIAFNCCIGAAALAVTVMCNTAGQSAFIMNFLLLFCLAFTGFLVNVESIQPFLRWLHFLSPFYYAFEAVLSSELGGQTVLFGYRLSPEAPVIEVPNVPAETFLATLGFKTSYIKRDLFILVGLWGFCVLAALVLFWARLPKTGVTNRAKWRGKKTAPSDSQ